MTTFLFLQIGVIWFLGMGFVYAGTFIVGALKTGMAARIFHRYVSAVFIFGAVLIAIQGIAAGDMQSFIASQGLSTLFELLLLGFGWVALMWFLSTVYANGKAYKEELAAEAPEEN